MKNYSVIVVGAGHAGIEAALAPARMGAAALMMNYSFDTIGQMSCNPAIGGVGKGQLVKEVDALGGEMGLAADRTAVQFRRLNSSKGAAVRSSRCQSDRGRYRAYMQGIVRGQKNLDFYTGEVAEILVRGGRVGGVRTVDGQEFGAPCVVIAAGTFLDGRLHCGPRITPGGRIDEQSSQELARNLESLGFVLRHFKTGTPPRLDGRTIDYTGLRRQDSDDPPEPFSFRTPFISSAQKMLPCWITHTNARTHRIISDHFHLSPMYSGQINATGVRYCPSIEDKLKKFGDKETHHVFLEPDGLDTPVVYPNGLSTGLPENVQDEFIHSMAGLEKAVILKYGYSIEHAVIYAEELKATLESRRIPGLFFAGQLNGTTGYEEAAAQGIMAGINAALTARGECPFILGRDEAYIGVLIDDLVTRGTPEPYRMFTSRVEYRLLVREDNADLRLARHACRLGLMTEAGLAAVEEKRDAIRRGRSALEAQIVRPAEINPVLERLGTTPVVAPCSLAQILRRPEVSLQDIEEFAPLLQFPCFTPLGADDAGLTEAGAPQPPRFARLGVVAAIEYEVKYEGFMDRQRKEVEKFRHLENIKVPDGFVYESVNGLSFEVRQKLNHFRPATLGQANRISGITPAAISLLMIALRGRGCSQ